MKTLDNAIGANKFLIDLNDFMKINNFKKSEIETIIHALNSFYFMGYPVEDSLNHDVG